MRSFLTSSLWLTLAGVRCRMPAHVSFMRAEEEEEHRGGSRSDFRRAEAEAEGGNTRDEAQEVRVVQVESIECVLADWVCVCMPRYVFVCLRMSVCLGMCLYERFLADCVCGMW